MKSRLERYLLELRVVLDGIDEAACDALAMDVARRDRIFVAGLGRSGAVMRAFASRLNQVERAAHVVLEPGTPDLTPGDLLVIGSGSGATETMVAVGGEARRRGAEVVLITSNALSPLARIADRRLIIPPLLPPELEESEPVTGAVQTVFEQALLLLTDALVARVGGLLGRRGPGFDPAAAGTS